MSNGNEGLREIIIDTSAFFAKLTDLRSFIVKGKTKLSTIDLVIFEFTKLMQAESEGSREDEKG